VAAGRLDGYWERKLGPWDYAAGLAIVQEAGGFVTDCDGEDGMFTSGDVASGNGTMHAELVTLLKAANRG
jgi:myo-inositol-1(or 4)-monophosphatase